MRSISHDLWKSNHIFFHPDYTVGFGIEPNRAFYARGLYRQSGISPYPEDTFILLFISNYNISYFGEQRNGGSSEIFRKLVFYSMELTWNTLKYNKRVVNMQYTIL